MAFHGTELRIFVVQNSKDALTEDRVSAYTQIMKSQREQPYIDESAYCDEIIMDTPMISHDRIYIAPYGEETENHCFSLNRAGSISRLSGVFIVRRNASTKMNNLQCVISGKGEVTFRGETFPVHAGQVYLLCAHEAHAYKSDPDDPLGLTWIEYYGANSEELTRHIIEMSGSPIVNGLVFSETVLSIMTILDRVEDDADYQPSIELYSLLYHLTRAAEPSPHTDLSNRAFYGRILALNAYIEQNLARAISVEELAERAGYSKYYFIRKFKQVHGVAPHEYIMRYRIMKSKLLLADAMESMDSIAQKLGFCNAGHYIRRFKAEEQISPAEYRRQNGVHFNNPV